MSIRLYDGARSRKRSSMRVVRNENMPPSLAPNQPLIDASALVNIDARSFGRVAKRARKLRGGMPRSQRRRARPLDSKKFLAETLGQLPTRSTTRSVAFGTRSMSSSFCPARPPFK